jgi:Asp/Glu/hydantoin racemase
MASTARRSILVINPNTTQAMTEGVKPLVHSLGYDTVSAVPDAI